MIDNKKGGKLRGIYGCLGAVLGSPGLWVYVMFPLDLDGLGGHARIVYMRFFG